jgi:tRNA pseudouridine synthase 10
MTRTFTLDKEDIENLEKCFSKGLCDACLGRCVAKKGHGLRNEERGAMVRNSLQGQPGPVAAEDCWLCEGLTDEYDKFARLVAKALGPHEFSTFVMGSKTDAGLKEREKELHAILGEKGFEETKSEVNREVGKRVCDLTGKDVDFKRADIVVLMDTRFDVVKLEVHSIFLYGRYRKLERGIPQTKWPCKRCRGKGCDRCGGTGKMYPTSVEEIIAGPVVERFKAKGQAFHGMGREDIDARMLGNGRPFVLELKEPILRDIGPDGLRQLEAVINRAAVGRVEIEGLRTSTKDEVRSVKDHRCTKSYRVEVEFGDEVEEGNLAKALEELNGKVIDQRTPKRVSHRRGDILRKRRVVAIGTDEGAPKSGKSTVLTIEGQAGIYIKELIAGDEGRTVPSLAGLLGLECIVKALDVIQIHDEEACDQGSEE